MNARNLVGQTSLRVLATLALEVAKHLIPIIQRKLEKRWKQRH